VYNPYNKKVTKQLQKEMVNNYGNTNSKKDGKRGDEK
jgi:hypothetical protein